MNYDETYGLTKYDMIFFQCLKIIFLIFLYLLIKDP